MKRRGSILMEFVIVAPLVLLLVSMILQFAHIWQARQITAYAAYCATRAIMAVSQGEQNAAAKKAAELACSWMSLVKLPSSTDADEVSIPGWGTIPGSDSAKIRVGKVEIHQNGEDTPLAEVTVQFKFPLMLPLAGRMISWAVNTEDGLENLDYGHHQLPGGNNPAWNGEEVVMDDSGNSVERRGNRVLDGKYPFITLTETCILPMPYSTANFPTGGYRSDLIRGGGS